MNYAILKVRIIPDATPTSASFSSTVSSTRRPLTMSRPLFPLFTALDCLDEVP
jgi:hypothetical protein